MSDDKMFDYVLARSRTGESSTLTIATVAASASLILLALYVQAQVDIDMNIDHKSELFDELKSYLPIFGVVFAICGILYRDATALSIHRNDERWLDACAKRCRKDECKGIKDENCKFTDPADYRSIVAGSRVVILRILLVIPIMAWTFVSKEIRIEISVIVGSLLYVGLVSYFEEEIELSPTNEQKSLSP